jgi:acetyltransferase-like isoleucine patch superfamily enzyme
MSKLAKALRRPDLAYAHVMRLVRGRFYKCLYALTRPRVTIGRNLRVEGSLDIRGPGRVVIGDDVTIGMRVTPWTHEKDAVIRIGDRAFLNGTRFGCADSITVGDDCILADCRIMDTDHHGTHPRRRREARKAPIAIGRNVWITIQCVVLKGVTIAEGCTVTPNSVVNRDLTQPNSIYGGNPAVFLKKAD